MAVCTYDNPDTMSRECWQDGRLVCYYSACVLALKEWPVRERQLYLCANIGDWVAGQIVGDKEAMPNAEFSGVATE